MWYGRLSLRVGGWALLGVAVTGLVPSWVWADGLVKGPAGYHGSLEERSQEAIIVFQAADTAGEATEDLILKIPVEGRVDKFAWVIPFPQQPVVKEAQAALFRELYDYVQYRLQPQPKPGMKGAMGGFGGMGMGGADDVAVLSRETVGSYDVAVVRENTRGRLNQWLADNGYQRIQRGEDVIESYRAKEFVFACIKVSDAKPKADAPVDLHPLRFTFKTGGRDGIYYPMRLTGLQEKLFDVNLYVFFRYWLNDHRNAFGYEHQGFFRRWRDWDTPQCKPDGGKAWSEPLSDAFLKPIADRIPTVAKLLLELHPGQRYYLTNLWASRLDPARIRKWQGDLWLFPYYRDRQFVPYDNRQGGPAQFAGNTPRR